MNNSGDKARGWYWAWLRKALLLSSFCCSAFTCTAGAYITVRLRALTTTTSLPSLPFPSPLTYWFVLVFISAPTSTSFTPNTHVQRLTQTSNQHLCLCRLWIGHDPPSAVSVPCGKKSKSSFESWKSMWVSPLTESRGVGMQFIKNDLNFTSDLLPLRSLISLTSSLHRSL